MAIKFLTVDEVLQIHADQLTNYGGKTGVRDLGMLDSALAQPASCFSGKFLHPSLPQMAAAYLYHICQNHPFADGNKRVALVASLMFLKLNKCPIEFNAATLEKMMLDVASGKQTKESIASLLA